MRDTSAAAAGRRHEMSKIRRIVRDAIESGQSMNVVMIDNSCKKITLDVKPIDFVGYPSHGAFVETGDDKSTMVIDFDEIVSASIIDANTAFKKRNETISGDCK